MKFNKSLNFQICSGFFFTNFILLLILGVIFYWISSDIIIEKERVLSSEIAKRRSEYLKEYTQRLKILSEILGKDERVYDFLKNENKSRKLEVLRLIENILKGDSYIKTIVILGQDGSVISNEKSLNMQTSKNMMREAWYLKALKEEKAVLNPVRKQSFQHSSVDDWVISISQEIVDENDKNLGVLLIDVDYKMLQEYLKTEGVQSDQEIVIVDGDTNIVYCKNIEVSDEKKFELEKIKNSNQSYMVKGEKIISTYRIENTDWVLIVFSSLKELHTLKNNLIKLFFLSGVLSFGITILISLIISNRIIRPIKKLERYVKKFSILPLDEIGNNTSEEVSNLTQNFNEMIEKIRYLREYEINALHSQINPHFLYNTLDTIIWMAEFQDNDKVISITKALANFFRISLSNGREKISLKEELEHVKEYLYIQKQRYEDKLEYSFDILERIYDVEVPKIILQPIVENSIYHGIRDIDGVGRIKIYSEIVGNKILIIVEDNGVGFDKERKKSNLKVGGIGIENVNKRIQFYYGEEFGVSVDYNFKLGARVIISLPYIKN